MNKERIWKVVRSMRNNKASGPEGVPTELIKYGTPKVIKHIQELFSRYINGEKVSLVCA